MYHICDYCGEKEAIKQFKNGKWCCGEYTSQCPKIRKKNCEANIGRLSPKGMLGKHHSEETIKKKRTPFKNIVEIMKDTTYILLTTKEEYENKLLKLKFRCPQGHEYETRWDSFKAGSRCLKCSYKIGGEKKRTPFKDIVEIVKDTTYILLTTEEEYENQFSKLRFKCPVGHEFEMRWDSFKAGSRCTKCVNKIKGEKCRTQFKEIQQTVERRNYIILTTEEEYRIQFPKKLKFRCPQGHEYETRWDSFKAGSGCPKCSKKEANKKLRIAAIKNIESRCGQCSPAYSPKACKLIDEYGEKNNYNFQHAENGGEFRIKGLGYYVDGYDKEKNVVIEIDERHHFDRHGNLSKRDVQRQKEIEEFLGCEFIRLKI
jgi:hypothetical protein